MLTSLLTVGALAVSVSASWEGNVNYLSPSLKHRSLGLDIPKIHKRTSLQARQATNFTDSQLNFTHGVASGDPYSNSVILWTRLAPSLASDTSNVTVSGYVPLYSHETEEYIRASSHRVCLNWVIASDKNLTKVANKGTAYTTSDIDFTVKVEATRLRPFTTYYYQFTQCGTSNRSPVGRTKSAPRPDDDVSKIGLAVYSCSNYPNGYFK
jgi:alkaline phosphatase D